MIKVTQLDECNAWCEPESGVHVILGYGDVIPVGTTVSLFAHGVYSSAQVLSNEPAVEVPPPELKRLRDLPAWLMRFQLV